MWARGMQWQKTSYPSSLHLGTLLTALSVDTSGCRLDPWDSIDDGSVSSAVVVAGVLPCLRVSGGHR